MWKLYRSRHLWLYQAYRLFAYFYSGIWSEEGSSGKVYAHGRQLLSTNSSSPEGVPGCIPPSLDEFPDDFFTQEQRARGGVLVHVLIVAYICAALAVVCDKYFVPCLNVISNYFQVPSDIAGATFMAMGASSPELFSSVIGAFVTEGDIGVGTVVGSAVFNILAVTGAAGFAVGTAALQLDWYPISRDTAMYIVTISTLVFIIHDNLVTWVESLVLCAMFMAYLILLYFNYNIQNVTTKTAKNVRIWWLRKKGDKHTLPVVFTESSALLVANRLARPRSYHGSTSSDSLDASAEMSIEEDKEKKCERTLEISVGKKQFPPLLVPELIQGKYVVVKDFEDSMCRDTLQKVSDDLESSLEVNLWSLPESNLNKFFYLLMWIPNFLFSVTIPRCNLPGRTKWFPLTFFASIVWLGALSYLCFWMVAVIGYTFNIPDTVSGITILAAGTSVPELVSSIIVVRSGLGNMAFCNLLGSNIFDILFCLGLPWLIKTLMNGSFSSSGGLVINSSALTYTTLILLIVVVLFYCTLVLCSWRLDWKYSIVAFALYVTFLVVSSLFESNVFGDFNPPVCPR
ncbi:hypothetical protein JTE90_017789 [Oedothorax gibbosus]|uniref:Sodium/calcium exchanger membrane region domain-containing protein n=1 Tax=Oedothorax gibbosus TaxID=931172 RepID=A0AAV6U731_9ARAC|nr:hypothetical protein JTE90_017789 [Oedothorax gibbosus]